MYQDARLLVSGTISATDNSIAGQAVSGTGVTVVSTNVIDLSQNRDVGEGEDFYARFQTTVAAVGGTSVEFQVVAADSADLTTTNPTVLCSTGAIPIASLIIGKRFALELPPRIGSVGQRYLGIKYVTVGAVTAGTYVADFGIEIQDGQKFHPSGFAII